MSKPSHQFCIVISLLLVIVILAIALVRAPRASGARLHNSFQQATATETLAPTETATDTLTQVAVPTEIATDTPTEIAAPTWTATDTPTEIPTPTETVTETPTPTLAPTLETETPAPTATPLPTETFSPTETFTPEPTATEQIETATLSPTANIAPSETPAPTETLTPLPTNTPARGIVRGRVRLQGRDDASEVVIQVGEQTWMLEEKRAFTLELAPGVYTFIFRRAGYLAEQTGAITVTSETTIELPTILLRGGDVNGDGVIDVGDVTQIADQFGATNDHNAVCDVNGDGEVNVLDLVLASANVGRGEFE